MSTCPDCKGSGEYVGFSSRELCQGCAGSGIAGDADRLKEAAGLLSMTIAADEPASLRDPKTAPNAQAEIAELRKQLRDARVIAIAFSPKETQRVLTQRWAMPMDHVQSELPDARDRLVDEQPKWIPVRREFHGEWVL